MRLLQCRQTDEKPISSELSPQAVAHHDWIRWLKHIRAMACDMQHYSSGRNDAADDEYFGEIYS